MINISLKQSYVHRCRLCAGTRISSFTQADLASRSVQYVHTSEEEKHSDQFSFTVSDGNNEVRIIALSTIIKKKLQT